MKEVLSQGRRRWRPFDTSEAAELGSDGIGKKGTAAMPALSDSDDDEEEEDEEFREPPPVEINRR